MTALRGKKMVSEAFAKWATGFSGCDGGNLLGSTWLCGLEYAGDDTEEVLRHKILEETVNQPAAVETPYRTEAGIREFLQSSYNGYNVRAVKLLCAFNGREVHEYNEFFWENRCFSRGSDLFKLNLYPIGFGNSNPDRWKEWHSALTGLPDKQNYLSWCEKYRFWQIQRWTRHYKPKLIICTGTESKEKFFAAFGADCETEAKDETTGKRILYRRCNGGETLVAVIYFLGNARGLISDAQLKATGQRLAQLLH